MKEIEINPHRVDASGALALDAMVILETTFNPEAKVAAATGKQR